MSWALLGAAAITGTATVVASKQSGGGGSPNLGFQQVPENKQVTAARKQLLALAGQTPEVPLRGIAPKPAPTEERRLARETAISSLEPMEPTDFRELPEVQAIIFEAKEAGDLLANRISRALKASGSFTSTPGRDVLARSVTDVQKSLTATLAPIAESQRNRAFADRQRIQALIPVLEGLGMTVEAEELRRNQSILDAQFSQEHETAFLPQTFTAPILASILSGSQPTQIPIISGGGQQSNLFSDISELIGPLLTSILNPSTPSAASAAPGASQWLASSPDFLL